MLYTLAAETLSGSQAVEPVLRENGCAVDRGKADAEGLQLVRQGVPCANMDSPNAIGVVQARNRERNDCSVVRWREGSCGVCRVFSLMPHYRPELDRLVVPPGDWRFILTLSACATWQHVKRRACKGLRVLLLTTASL